MPGSIKAPEEYSTNPNTIKARRRKMNLNGAQKVEDAARTADYKAMIYARKVIQAKQEYKAASDSEKSAMLEKAMRDTMVKRYVALFPGHSQTRFSPTDLVRCVRSSVKMLNVDDNVC